MQTIQNQIIFHLFYIISTFHINHHCNPIQIRFWNRFLILFLWFCHQNMTKIAKYHIFSSTYNQHNCIKKLPTLIRQMWYHIKRSHIFYVHVAMAPAVPKFACKDKRFMVYAQCLQYKNNRNILKKIQMSKKNIHCLMPTISHIHHRHNLIHIFTICHWYHW